MSTPFSDIFVKSHILFEDIDLLADLDEDDYLDLLELFLNKSKSIYFKSCRKDLSDVDYALKKFNQTLDLEEQFILAEGIKLVWLEKQLYRKTNLRDKMTTKDYNASHSPANLIDKLSGLVEKTRKNLKEIVNDYTFNSFSGFN